MKTGTEKKTGVRIARGILFLRIAVTVSIVRNKKTTKELKENGLLSQKVGFSGLRKNTVISKSLNDSYYADPDERSTFTFRLFSKKVDIITEHLRGSDRFISRNDKVEFQQIDNRVEYRNISKYAVIT